MSLIYVQRDPRYAVVRRSLRYSCTREEWDSPRWRQQAIDRAWHRGLDAIRASGNCEFVAAAPVVLYKILDQVLYANIAQPGRPPEFIYPNGERMDPSKALLAYGTVGTTYLKWAEGPLPGIALTDESSGGLSEDDRRAIEGQHRVIRERMMQAVSGAGESPEVGDYTKADPDLVDFRVRGYFKVPDYTVLLSRQQGGESKVITSDGVIEHGHADTLKE
jgi:hypothetical protein